MTTPDGVLPSRWSMEADAEMEAMVAGLEQAGLLEVHTEGSRVQFRLTAEGSRVARLLAMGSADDAQVVLDALLADTGL